MRSSSLASCLIVAILHGGDDATAFLSSSRPMARERCAVSLDAARSSSHPRRAIDRHSFLTSSFVAAMSVIVVPSIAIAVDDDDSPVDDLSMPSVEESRFSSEVRFYPPPAPPHPFLHFFFLPDADGWTTRGSRHLTPKAIWSPSD